MRVLRDNSSITAEIASNPDSHIADQLSLHLQFAIESEDFDLELLTVLMVEPGDALPTVDAAMNGQLLADHYFGKRFGDPDFKPCFETLEEYPTFYEMLFVQSDEGRCLTALIPKSPGVDPELLAICAAFSAQPTS